jgi:26S proteasome regulatory subunit T6
MGRPTSGGEELRAYFKSKIEEFELRVKDKTHNLRRLEAQRNELNTQGTDFNLHHLLHRLCRQTAVCGHG